MVDEKTSPQVAKKAARILQDSNSSPQERSVAASALAQAGDVRADVAAAPSQPIPDTVANPKVKFAEAQKSPTLEIGHGPYSRKFSADDQPFECVGFRRNVVDELGNETGEQAVVMTAEEEFAVLVGTGHFVEA